MKTLLTVLSICISYAVFASHHLGGYIVAKQVSGRLYQISTVLLTDPNAPANNFAGDISLQFGDGITEIINRTSVTTEDGIQKSVYTTNHTYATEGIYAISFTNPNLPDNIVNVNGGISNSTPFQITSLIKVSNMLSGVQSASPLAFEFVNASFNNPTTYNPTFVGGDNDFISYELVTQPNALPNYFLPEGSSVNPYSGMLTFTPKMKGLFLFVIKVSSYRAGTLTAQSEVIQLFKVTETNPYKPTVDFMLASLHPQGWYSRELVPNQNIDQQVNFTGVSGPYTVELYSELFDKGATSSIIQLMPNSMVTNINWTALAQYARATPYFITYRFRSSAENMVHDYNIAFYHGAPINTGLHNQASNDQYVIIYPNPVYGATQCYFAFKDFQHAQLSVYDALGRMIISESVNGKSVTLETSTWKSGMYTYSLLMENGEVLNGKLMVK